ncbi:MAG TPA: dipeptide epimerase [Bacteroidota bacterium]|nr:dipeptide epimerase [Bacteroidota bacterium]
MTPALTWSVVELRLKHVFTIARGSRSVVPTVIVQLSHDGITGYGEASPLARYGESVDTVARFLGRVGPAVLGDPSDPDALLDRVGSLEPGNASAKASVDIAIHDWIGKRRGVPTWKYFGIDRPDAPASSITIGIDSPGVVERKVREADAFGILKVKMGVPGDREFIRTVRKFTSKPLRVDANEGWKTKEEALEALLWLRDLGVELVEQPLPAGNPDAVAWLKARAGIPLYADEDFSRHDDLGAIAGAYDGVNIKLMKSTGLREARKIIGTAHGLGLKIMIGCMIETSVGISAAAQISPMADVTDLDGCLLVSNDPFRGAVAPDGTIRLNDLPGIGVTREAR